MEYLDYKGTTFIETFCSQISERLNNRRFKVEGNTHGLYTSTWVPSRGSDGVKHTLQVLLFGYTWTPC